MTPVPRGTVGFSRLADLLPLAVTISRGSLRVGLSAADLESRLAIPGLAARLADLLARTADGLERGERGASRNTSSSLSANALEESLNATALAPGVKEGSGEPSGGPGAMETSPVENPSTESLARYLATRLGGSGAPAHLAFYRLVTRTVPREIVMDALTRALDARAIRKSRAHLFSYLIRKHLPHRSLTNEPSP